MKSTVQTFIKKEKLGDFKKYMEKHHLTPYKAAADLIALGLEYDRARGRLERGSEEAAETDRGEAQPVVAEHPRKEPPFITRKRDV